jgi:hypothetical protein
MKGTKPFTWRQNGRNYRISISYFSFEGSAKFLWVGETSPAITCHRIFGPLPGSDPTAFRKHYLQAAPSGHCTFKVRPSPTPGRRLVQHGGMINDH